MLIEIKGVHFVNRRPELMLNALLDQVRDAFDDVELTTAPSLSSGGLVQQPKAP